ncbi:MAG: hypothetical protein AB8H03_09405 [Saprospiraceae bacterium]
MNESNPKIDVEKVVKTIDENLKALKEGMDPTILTQEERDRISKDLEGLIEMALKIKADSKRA